MLVGFPVSNFGIRTGGAGREEERRTPNTWKESRPSDGIVSRVGRRREQNIRINKTRLAKVSFVTAGGKKGRRGREGMGDLAIGGI